MDYPIVGFRQLFGKDGSRKYSINSVYLDTIFCIPQAEHIPSRERCLEIISSTARDWLGKAANRVVHISTKYDLGY